jgi:hypothetical protein
MTKLGAECLLNSAIAITGYRTNPAKQNMDRAQTRNVCNVYMLKQSTLVYRGCVCGNAHFRPRVRRREMCENLVWFIFVWLFCWNHGEITNKKGDHPVAFLFPSSE